MSNILDQMISKINSEKYKEGKRFSEEFEKVKKQYEDKGFIVVEGSYDRLGCYIYICGNGLTCIEKIKF